jgi:hypothetical protein
VLNASLYLQVQYVDLLIQLASAKKLEDDQLDLAVLFTTDVASLLDKAPDIGKLYRQIEAIEDKWGITKEDRWKPDNPKYQTALLEVVNIRLF